MECELASTVNHLKQLLLGFIGYGDGASVASHVRGAACGLHDARCQRASNGASVRPSPEAGPNTVVYNLIAIDDGVAGHCQPIGLAVPARTDVVPPSDAA